jgi:hypothetical protein
MGAKSIRLEEPGDVKEALTEALQYKEGPVVVDAIVDPFALSLPSHVPLHTAISSVPAKRPWIVRRSRASHFLRTSDNPLQNAPLPPYRCLLIARESH